MIHDSQYLRIDSALNDRWKEALAGMPPARQISQGMLAVKQWCLLPAYYFHITMPGRASSILTHDVIARTRLVPVPFDLHVR